MIVALYCSNDKGELCQTVDQSNGFAILIFFMPVKRTTKKFILTKFFPRPLCDVMSVHMRVKKTACDHKLFDRFVASMWR